MIHPRPLVVPGAGDRNCVLRGMLWGLVLSAALWAAMYVAWRAWGWWGPLAVLGGGTLAVVVVALAYRRHER